MASLPVNGSSVGEKVLLVDVDLEVAAADVGVVAIAATGNITPLQRDVVSEKTQQESVAFGELAAQYEQSPAVLSVKPQLSGSFSTPSMQVEPIASAGRAQFVKSALSCLAAFGPGLPQRLLYVMLCSVSTYEAHVSAHSGAVATPSRLHAWMEFCTIALHKTLVVKRA